MASRRTAQYLHGELYQRMSDDLHLAGMAKRTQQRCVQDHCNVLTEPRWGSNGRGFRSRGSRVPRQPLAVRHNRTTVESHQAVPNRVRHQAQYRNAAESQQFSPHKALQPHEYRNAVSSDSLGLLPTATTPGRTHPITLNSEGVLSPTRDLQFLVAAFSTEGATQPLPGRQDPVKSDINSKA
jgi:hypothetical protein